MKRTSSIKTLATTNARCSSDGAPKLTQAQFMSVSFGSGAAITWKPECSVEIVAMSGPGRANDASRAIRQPLQNQYRTLLTELGLAKQ